MAQALAKFTRISSTPAYRMVAEAIERDILAGRLRDGEPLGTEAELATQFGVNRSTVREGIRLLEHGGLIRRDSSRRLWVGVPHTDGLATRMSRALVLHEVSFRELYEAAMALQLATIDAAVEHATVSELAALERNIDDTERVLPDPAAVAKLDGEFHTLVGKASHNRVLQLAREPSELLVVSSTVIVRNSARFWNVRPMPSAAMRWRGTRASACSPKKISPRPHW